MSGAYIVDAVRTPRGRRNGGLANTHPIDLAAIPIKKLIERSRIEPRLIDEVIYGCVSQRGEQDNVIARGAVLAAGLPEEVAAYTVNRFCGSGLTAVNAAAHACMSGQEDLIIAGGVEHMTRVPMAIDFNMKGTSLERRYPELPHQGISAEMIADRYQFSRRVLDEFAAESQKRAANAWEEDRFKRGIVPVGSFERDEHLRPTTTVETLANLKPSFKPDGKIHAGNSSGIVDGAAAVLIASKKGLEKTGLKPRARIIATAQIGSDPVYMLLGIIPCTGKLLEKAELTLRQIDLYEVNEAFAPVPMAWLRDLKEEGASWDKLNVNGGAIALGHPIGATGAILAGTVLDELERTDKRYGLVTLCTGLGMAVAAIIERL
ncbi:MAG: thiolase family protein [Deltaproteobacteria bacterium]|nr:thiolase family protein [Deltaproteobacteria bacterium]MBI4373481.1 thiolase family protein [Deltaproteobacteria bacterium]